MSRRSLPSLKNDKLLFFGVFLSLFCFFPILTSEHLLDKDAALVIEPLSGIKGLGDYFDIFLTKKLLDIQPIRDLFLFINIFLTRIIGHQTFGFANWFIWILTCFYARQVARYYGNKKVVDFFLLLLVTHPMMMWVISWPLAMKHLLSSLFCLIAFFYSVKFKHNETQNTFLVFVFFFLSLLSQPISIFFPFIVLIFFWPERNKKEVRVLLGILFLSSLVIGILNWFYYSNVFAIYSGTTIIQPPFSIGLSQRLFVFSRAMTQIFFPIAFAGDYNPASTLGLVGIPLLAIVLYLKRVNLKQVFFFLSLIFYPLVSANVRITSVFLSDTYLVTSLVGVFLLLCFKVGSLNKLQKIFLFLALILFVIKSCYESFITIESEKYLETSYQREPGCKNLVSLTAHYLKEVKLDAFYSYSSVALKNKCFMNGLFPQLMINNLYAFRVYLDQENSLESKLITFKKGKYISPDVGYLQVLLLGRLGELEKAQKLFRKLPMKSSQFSESLVFLQEKDCKECPRIE